MNAALFRDRFSRLVESLDPSGPIFQKELTLAARRGRHYALRAVYVLIMAVVLAFAWFADPPGNATMSEFGLRMVVTLGVFHFIALQLVAPALTGSLLSDEFHKQTLPSLLMTPITNFQIVSGKLLSRMLMVLLLAAANFPVLAILRVFGGVEWQLIVVLEALTISAALFAAAVSLYLSSFSSKQSHDAAIGTYAFLFILYGVLPILVMLVLTSLGIVSDQHVRVCWTVFNPVASLVWTAASAFQPGGGGPAGLASPWVQCSFLLVTTFFLLSATSRRVRRMSRKLMERAEPSATQRLAKGSVKPEKRWTDVTALLGHHESLGQRFLADKPVLWRQWRKIPISSGELLIVLTVLLAILAFTYWWFWAPLQKPQYHAVYVDIFLFFLVAVAVTDVPPLVHEREAGTLEMLLTTALTPRDILLDNALAILPMLVIPAGLLLFHLAFFSLAGVVHPWHAALIVVIVTGPILFLMGTGTYFSLRARQVRRAQSHNQVLALVLWLVLPMLTMVISPMSSLVPQANLFINPFAGVFVALSPDAELLEGADIGYGWFSLIWIAASILYAMAGRAALRLGIRRFYRLTREPDRAGVAGAHS